MNKVLLIQPLGYLNKADPFSRTSEPEPLSLEYFQAILEQIDVISDIHYGKIDEDKLFQEFLSTSIIAVCFSVYTYQYPYCLGLAKKIKTVFRDLNKEAPTIIFGGYHSSAMPEIVIKEEPIDIVIKGEGEYALRDVIKNIIQKESLSNVNGIWYKNENGVPLKTSNRERIENIDQLPFPKRHLEFISKYKQFQITYPAASLQKGVAQVIYSKGCSYSCIFCSSESIWGKKITWRSPKSVLDEIESLHNTYGTNLIFFPDLTFNHDKKRVIDICNEFVKRDLPIHWFGLFRLDKLDAEILHALKEAKCMKLSIGIETDNTDADKLKGNFSISKDEYYKILNIADEIGLVIKAFLIIGFPNDTVEKIRNYNIFLRTTPIDEIVVSFITPFPGTPIWNEYHKNYLPNDYDFSEFTVESPVINHPTLTKQQLLDLRLEIVQNFYLDVAYQKRILDKIAKYPHLRNSYFEYFKFLEDSGVFYNNQLTNFLKERML
ncbi:MAG: B12-binding domain-containing radical SAM protein [Chitinispirillales bacterium]|jgi:radical SAM superfamily enzyme YgiQ (UPF0313 family)|nr:B12-binding domain-containing radical SAM protein [Chitinispirillales bacterium]